MSKNSHILCIAAGHGEGRFAPALGFTTVRGPIEDHIQGDLWVGPRPTLERMRPVAEPGLGTLTRLIGGEASISDLFGGSSAAAAFDAGATGTGFGGMMSELFGGDARSRMAYPTHLQIIPYYLFRSNGRYFNYLRPDSGNEARLHGKVSIGVGGHVDLLDVVATDDGRIDLARTLEKAGRREAAEEIGADVAEDAFRIIGVLYATDEEVDTVHVGIVCICDLDDAQVAALKPNDEIAQPDFRTLGQIRDETEADPGKTLETWTRLVIESNPLA
jgi:predicted NUDIX family phosphoesterase